jgi:hypothetical protein
VKNDLDGASNSSTLRRTIVAMRDERNRTMELQSLEPSLDETLNLADEAIFTAPRNRPETHPWLDGVDQTRGSIMLVLFLNAIYGRFLDAALPGMAIQGARQWPR